MVFALRRGDALVAVTHECDFPEAAKKLPRITWSRIDSNATSKEIDETVTSALQSGSPLYELDVQLLEQLQPDLIITQGLCDVCAVSSSIVHQAVQKLSSNPVVLNLEPHTLQDILENIREVGLAIDRQHEAENLIAQISGRIENVRECAKTASSRPRVFCMEWVDPPYCGGHWMKELVEIAGGRDDLSKHALPSHRIDWNDVLCFSPEVLVLTCCGFDLKRSMGEAEILASFPGIFDLPAVKHDRLFATAGSGYFSRPGPRIVDSLEMLAYIIHPEIFAPPAVKDAFAKVRTPVGIVTVVSE